MDATAGVAARSAVRSRAGWHLPLRYPALTLVFLALTLENPSDAPACGVWRSPLYGFGGLLLAHLNLTFSSKALIFSGMDVLLALLFVVVLVRRLTGSRVEGRAVTAARAMGLSAWVCIGGAAWMWLYGLARDDFDMASSFWQVQRVVYLPIVLFLFLRALRGATDARTLGKVIVAAACVKAIVAVYVRQTVAPPPGQTVLDYATTHADSMLFSVAICFVLAPLFEQYGRKNAVIAIVVVPVLLAGIVANTRRLAWVEVGIGLLTLFFASHPTRLKRRLTRTVLVMSPFIVAYLVAGWDSQGGVFRPVQILQSVVDSKADASTEWRDWENYDLFYTIRQAPLLGTGYGHGYIEQVKLADISRAYSLYRFIPHNSILGLWAYGGLVGFSALWAMLLVGGYLGARAHRFAISPDERVASLAVPAVLAVYLAHCYGDMGLGTWTAIFIVAPTLAIAAQLAVSTGAWLTVRTRGVPLEPVRARVVAVGGGAPRKGETGLVRAKLW
jgi:hypothetical protein